MTRLTNLAAGGVALALCCNAWAAPAAAPLASYSHQASTALAAKDYKATLELSLRAMSEGEPSPQRSWYRMAIAHAHLGQFAQADGALSAAEKLDPKLSFATSPQRVQTLRDLIRAGRAGPPADVQELTPDDADLAGPAVEVRPAATTPAAAASAPAPAETPAYGVAPGAAAAASAPVATAATPVGATAPAPTAAVRVKLPTWVYLLLFAVLVLAGAACLVMILEKVEQVIQRRRARDLVRMPLPQLLLRLRDEVALTVRRLDGHNETDSAVRLALGKALPLLEMEAGRAAAPQVPLKTVLRGLPHRMKSAAPVLRDEGAVLERGREGALRNLRLSS